MCLSTRNSNNLFVYESLNFCWIRLIWLVFIVFWKFSNIIQTKLTKTCLTPSKNKSFFCKCHRMRITASQLSNCESLKTFNLFWYRHKWTPVDIKWHLKYITKPELTTWPSSKAVYFSSICKDHRMNISTRCMN